jgi:hypothetical protein
MSTVPMRMRNVEMVSRGLKRRSIIRLPAMFFLLSLIVVTGGAPAPFVTGRSNQAKVL